MICYTNALLRVLYGVLFVWVSFSGIAQDDLHKKTEQLEDSIRLALYKERPYYQVVNYGANRIQFQDSLAMQHFFKALQQLQQTKKGTVNILHIGDSHIQADFFTGRVRYLLQESFGNAGRGLTFPYSAAKTNNPFDYKTRYTGTWTSQKIVSNRDSSQWGVTGITLHTNDPRATITIQPMEYNAQDPAPIEKIRVYYPILNEELFEAVVLAPTNLIESQKMHPDGYLEVVFAEPQTSVSIGLNRTNEEQTHFLLQGISLETKSSGIVYHAVGVNGAETRHFLRCEDFDVQLRSIEPDLVIISLGTNDAYPSRFDDMAYKGNLIKLIEQIRKINPQTSILLTSPNDTFRYKRYPNYNTAKAEQRLLELMREKKVALWNFYQIMGGFKSITNWKNMGLGQYDRIHLSQKGYLLQGDLFFEALMNAYQKWLQQHDSAPK